MFIEKQMGERRKLPFFRSKSIWVKMNAENYVNFYLPSQDFFEGILKILDGLEKIRIKLMRTVIEYSEFTKKAEKLFGSDERETIVSHLSSNPKAGKKLEQLGGIRKLEWKDRAEHNIYFHPGTKNLPLVVIAIYRKNEKLIIR